MAERPEAQKDRPANVAGDDRPAGRIDVDGVSDRKLVEVWAPRIRYGEIRCARIDQDILDDPATWVRAVFEGGFHDYATHVGIAVWRIESNGPGENLVKCHGRIVDQASLSSKRAPASVGFYNGHMTDAIAFDTHRFVKRLTESGFTEKQAETLAEEHVALLNANLATKTDIAKIEAAIAKVETNLLKWLFGALVAQGGLIVALIKLL